MIIEYDFGKKERPGSKRFMKPAAAEAPVGVRTFGKSEANLERANARIARLETALRSANAAAAGRDAADQGQDPRRRGGICGAFALSRACRRRLARGVERLKTGPRRPAQSR